MPKLGLGLSLPQTRITSKSVIPKSGLSLWLKADAGVTFYSYSFKSNITLSLAGQSSINGSYSPDEFPPSNQLNSYILVGPNNNEIEVRTNSNPIYRLYNTSNSDNSEPPFWYYDFSSNNGTTWTVSGKKPVSITLSGLTGTSATSNGTYENFQWDTNNESFISGKTIAGIPSTTIKMEISPNGLASAYILSTVFFVSATQNSGWGIGSWTLEEGTGTPVGTGTLYPTGGVPTGVVTTTNVNTTDVTVWSDQSGNTNDATATGTITLATINAKAFMNFASGYFVGNQLLTQPQATIMLVARFTSDVEIGVMFQQYDGNNQGDNMTFYRGFAGADGGYRFFNGDNLDGNSQTVTNQTFLLGVTVEDQSANLFFNGNANGSGAIGSRDTGGQYYLGRWGGGETTTTPLRMAEIVVYDRVLTTPERQQVEAYLGNKYAIELSP